MTFERFFHIFLTLGAPSEALKFVMKGVGARGLISEYSPKLPLFAQKVHIQGFITN
jgi:hypothetical protein